MTLDSRAHRVLTLALFAIVIGGLLTVNAFVAGGGWRGVALLAATIASAFAINWVIDAIRRAARAR